MEEISIEKFKMGYHNIADLIVSLDKNHKAILKPRDEIISYLESKSMDIQDNIIDELIDAHDNGSISESYLENKGKDYWQKLTFKDYFNMVKQRIEIKIRNNQIIDDLHIIKAIKEKLKGINNNELKIKYLLEEKQKYFKNVYDFDFLTEIAKAPISIFINSELEYWEKNIKIIDKGTEITSQALILQSTINDNQKEKLFDKSQDLLIETSKQPKLLIVLSEYISGINAIEFTNIIKHHSLTPGTPKAKWKGIPADAARFADHLKMRFSDFNKCFELKDTPKLLPNHRQKVRESGECTTSDINTILEKYILK